LSTSGLSHHVVTELETAHGPADYAFLLDGQIVGILEAKRRDIDPQNVLSVPSFAN